ncbi:MAG: hypothetical protein ABIQ13_09175 [Pedococcus sp.]
MRQRLGVAVVVACVVALAGCSADDAPPSVSPTSPGLSASSGIASTSPTPTATKSLSLQEKDLRSAEMAITEYWKVIDEAASNPSQNLNILATVARSQALAQWQTTLAGYRSKSWVQRGSSTVKVAGATTKDGEDFTVIACRDASVIDITDSSGKSVVLSDRPDQQQFTYAVSKTPEGFFVTEDLLKGSPCAS